MTAALSSYLSNSKASGRPGKASGTKANASRLPSAADDSIVAPGPSDRLGEDKHVGSSCDEIRKMSLLVVRRDGNRRRSKPCKTWITTMRIDLHCTSTSDVSVRVGY